jgi:hypothetical protein
LLAPFHSDYSGFELHLRVRAVVDHQNAYGPPAAKGG